MAKVPHIKLVDSTFAQSNALGLSGEREGEHPTLMRWDRTNGKGRIKVWTDLRLQEADGESCWRKVALLVESPAYSRPAIQAVQDMDFDVVLTHNKALVEEDKRYLFYPLAGSRIREWGMFEKTEMVSVIVGKKCDKEGQQLRHRVAQQFPEIAAYGEPYTEYLPTKIPMLRPYRYSVVIENIREDYYWSEKFVDAVSQGCVPIYWGCPSIEDFFDPNGLIIFNDLRDLREILAGLSEEDYESRQSAIRCNLELIAEYYCAEDWIMRHYPWLFQ